MENSKLAQVADQRGDGRAPDRISLFVLAARQLLTAAIVLLLALAPQHSLAQQLSQRDEEMLTSPFDPANFRQDELRVLQLAMAVVGYDGDANGLWLPNSQQALQPAVAAYGLLDGGTIANMHIAAMASAILQFIHQSSLEYQSAPEMPFLALLPEPPTASDINTYQYKDQKIDVGFYKGADRTFTQRLHQEFEPFSVEPLLRFPAFMRTDGVGEGRRFSFRSILMDDGSWASIMVENQAADDALYKLIISSVYVPGSAVQAARTAQPEPGLLTYLLSLFGDNALPTDFGDNALPNDSFGGRIGEAPQAQIENLADLTPTLQPAGFGTAFYINNYDMVTARHVVEDCDAVALVSGDEIEVVAKHQSLDLALLRSPKRSGNWIPLDQTGDAMLGTSVLALGYPYYGILGTSLTATTGVISALRGIYDDPSSITVSAAIQPGNSGGPIVGPNGTILGVVTATYDKFFVADNTQSIPENTNFAIGGRSVLEFLYSEQVVFPSGSDGRLDFSYGVPQGMQEAVLPVVCYKASPE